MTRLVPVADLGTIRPGATLSVAAPPGDVALFNVQGTVYALDDTCARCGTHLSEGTCSDLHVVCAGCGWEYDLRTGAVSAVPDLRIHTFDVTVVGSQLMLRLANGHAD